MPKRTSFCIIALLLLSGAVTGCSAATTSESGLTYGNAIGNKAYDFSLPDLNDNYVSLSSLQGHPVVLNFWSTT